MIDVKIDPAYGNNQIGKGQDATDIIQRAINDACGLNPNSIRVGEEVYISAGTYTAGNIVVLKPVRIRGDSSFWPADLNGSSDSFPTGTIINIPADKSGFIITRLAIESPNKDEKIYYNASGTNIMNIEFASTNPDTIQTPSNASTHRPTTVKYTVVPQVLPLPDGAQYIGLDASDNPDGSSGVLVHDDGLGTCAIKEYTLPTSGAYNKIRVQINASTTVTITVSAPVESTLAYELQQPDFPKDHNQFGIHVDGACFVKIEEVTVHNVRGNGIHISGNLSPMNETNETAIKTVLGSLNLLPSPGASAFPRASNLLSADTWRINNCSIRHCGKNGLFVENGNDTNSGICIGLNTYSNNEWGVKELSFLGNAYIACFAEANAQIFTPPTPGNDYYYPWALPNSTETVSQSNIYFGGSYLVDNPDNYGTFFSCYSESDNMPNFSNAQNLTVYGGSLGADLIKWDRSIAPGDPGINKTVHLTGQNRVDGSHSKLKFREIEYSQDPETANLSKVSSQFPTLLPEAYYTTREMYVSLPELHNKGAIQFSYRPPSHSQEIYALDKEDNKVKWMPENTISYNNWMLKRQCEDEGPSVKGGGRYFAGSLDRTWLFSTVNNDNSLNNSPNYNWGITPFGWTDRQHPLGLGHFFFGNTIANQSSHFSWKQQLLDVKGEPIKIIKPGVTIVMSGQDIFGNGYPLQYIQYWAQKMQDNGDSDLKVAAFFSLEYNPHPIGTKLHPKDNDTDFMGSTNLPLSITEHHISKRIDGGNFYVKIYNPNPVAVQVLGSNYLLHAHFEAYEIWPGDDTSKYI